MQDHRRRRGRLCRRRRGAGWRRVLRSSGDGCRSGRRTAGGLLHELHELRQPPVFSRAAPQVTLMQVNGALQAGAAVATNAVPENDDPMSAAAASTVVLRAGQHFAQFTVRAGEEMHLGLIRPDYKLVQEQDSMDVDAEDVRGHCFFYTYNGWRYPGQRDWQGMQGKPRDTVARARVNDRIGLLLDFDTGSLTAFKNDRQLGVMATGLTGEYCWAVALYPEHSVRISSGPAPAGPTVEEVAAALAWDAASVLPGGANYGEAHEFIAYEDSEDEDYWE